MDLAHYDNRDWTLCEVSGCRHVARWVLISDNLYVCTACMQGRTEQLTRQDIAEGSCSSPVA